MPLKSVHYSNLNALRCIAVFIVIIHHIEAYKNMFSIGSNCHIAIINMGKLGVVLFFVLSGFLITNLLLIEQKSEENINIVNFYKRRILRIWPLYFFIVTISLFLLPHLLWVPEYDLNEINSHIAIKSILFIFLLPNLVNSLFGALHYTGHLWSIGVEEQFYLIWPISMKFIKNKTLFIGILSALYIMIKYLLIHSNFFVITKYWLETPIDCLAIGGLFSLINMKYTSISKIIFKKYIQYPVFIGTTIFMFLGIDFGFLQYEVYAIMFGIIISNLALNAKRIMNLEKIKSLNYLGKISYGIYMYHPMVIVFVIDIMLKFQHSNSIIIYTLSFILTIGISALSYHFIESKFLKLKTRFSTIITGGNN
ncbi:MAG TPA: acyltransferase [Bacteroidia bacterium]|jgi:peptidoglycan/LPS O-acetylase OafA/YrhL|nr:acyltransferase [Bacteroidia bacterium]